MSDYIQQQGAADYASRNRFTISPIPRHIHNNIDSPYVLQPVLVYAGYVRSDGANALNVTNDPLHASGIFPAGWTVSLASHVYTVTHNLGTTLYTVVATPTTLAAVATFSTIAPNYFTIATGTVTGSPGAIAPADEPFNFMLVSVANKGSIAPQYVFIK